MVRNGCAEVPGLESLPLVDTYKVPAWALNSDMVRNDIDFQTIVLTFMPPAWGNSAIQVIASRLIFPSVSRRSVCPSLSDTNRPLRGVLGKFVHLERTGTGGGRQNRPPKRRRRNSADRGRDKNTQTH